MNRYRIQAVAQMTGLSPAVIRAWEARYALVAPQRTAAGYRLYSDEDVAVLRGVQRRIRAGMAPAQVARLDRAEILRGDPGPAAEAAGDPGDAEARAPLPDAEAVDEAGSRGGPGAEGAEAGGTEPAPEGSAGGSADPRVGGAGDPVNQRAGVVVGYPDSRWVDAQAHRADTPGLYAGRINEIIEACKDFDRDRVEQVLSPLLLRLPVEVACSHVLVPLLREIGERWHRGEVSVAVEHFCSHIVRSKLIAFFELLRRKSGDKRVLCACAPGELHELGLMVFTLHAAGQGWDPIYLGANVPLASLAEAVRHARPSVVALSISQRHDATAFAALLDELRAAIPQTQLVIVGGRGVTGQEDLIGQVGFTLLPASGRLDDLQTTPD